MSVEFSIPVAAAELPPRGTSVRRKADPQERAALAERLGVESVEEFDVGVSIVSREDSQSVSVEGTLDATVVQNCSVSLEPMAARHSLIVALEFVDEALIESQDVEEIDAEGSSPPEPMIDGRFDVGDTLVQILAVEIDPFPRKPGISLKDIPEVAEHAGAPDDARSNPFAVLSEFRDRLKDR